MMDMFGTKHFVLYRVAVLSSEVKEIFWNQSVPFTESCYLFGMSFILEILV